MKERNRFEWAKARRENAPFEMDSIRQTPEIPDPCCRNPFSLAGGQWHLTADKMQIKPFVPLSLCAS